MPSAKTPLTFVVVPRGYRIEDAAIYMCLTPFFIEEEIRAGRLPALHLCRHYTILKEDMDAYLDAAKAAWQHFPARNQSSAGSGSAAFLFLAVLPQHAFGERYWLEERIMEMSEMKIKAKELQATMTNYDLCFQLILVQVQMTKIRERLDALEPKAKAA
jgi:hypothetical protein